MKHIILTAIVMLSALTASAQTLVVYYSRTGQNYTSDGIVNLKVGNTQVVAEKIQKLTGADIFRLETVRTYSEDYMTCTQEAREELNAKARPALKADIDISKYDTIYLGWPCWWGTYPMCVATFLEAHDWAGKTVIPFTTHEGSGFGSGLRDLKAAIPSATVKKGLSIQGSKVKSAQAQIEKFVNAQK
ncbi:MAG: flavodoxin [Bacteroidales bacterium]|nr:flavodoxin [Bacteroidales bacterium]MBR0286590.1 flavodoxin [Bacteroidales bacterium]